MFSCLMLKYLRVIKYVLNLLNIFTINYYKFRNQKVIKKKRITFKDSLFLK